MSHAQSRGFTIFELMIVVAIIGILAAIGIPTYGSFACKGRKTDAHTALMSMSQAQERYYLQNSVYAGQSHIANVGGSATAQGYYILSIDPPADASTYTLTATDVNAGNLCDPACAAISLDSAGQRTPAACW